MQCELVQNTVQCRELSTGRQHLTSWSVYKWKISEYGITFQRGTLCSISLEVFADADYASKATDRRSVPGGAIMWGGASAYWFPRTHKRVTLLTSEAEYVVLGDTVKELFLRQIWCFMLPSKVMPCFPVF